MIEAIQQFFRKSPPSSAIGRSVDQQVAMYTNQRKSYERRWYDNNFFDDGHHFRYLSKTTGKIVDLSSKQGSMPQRAIPKASRQIRGITNLLLAPEYTPIVYPENVSKTQYQNPQEYLQALQVAKDYAKKTGHWIKEEFRQQEIIDKTILMLILAAKNSVSYMQIWPDAVQEKIRTQVYDAFDIYLAGEKTEIYDSPSLIKAVPELISVIKANENFDPEQLQYISPDNKYASSEIKQAYMQSKYGSGMMTDEAATLIQKEAFIKEYINDENIERIRQFANDDNILDGKNYGDVVMRHVFTAGGLTLKDEYVGLPEYPFVDFRFEPGSIYQVPLIERFIPANKSLDIVMSRIEGYSNTMITGIYQKRKGENFEVTNTAGGQVIEYDSTPLQQMNMASIPPFLFDFMGMLEKIIEEQGASTSSLGVIPTGVRSGVAIESVKSTEYANLKIASMMLKKTTKRIAEKFMDIADSFIDPQTVYLLEKGNPSYFDIIGQKGVEARERLGISASDAVPIKKSYRVNIEVESGLGFTQEGRRETAQQIINFMMQFVESGILTQDAVKVLVQKTLETFQFGATQEFMEAMDSGAQSSPLTEEQLSAMKIAVLEVLKDAGLTGDEADQKFVDSTKIGVVEALKDTGMLEKKKEPEVQKAPSQSISFKDLPPEGKAQMAAQAGILLDPETLEEVEPENHV